jgi:hypothetical protein
MINGNNISQGGLVMGSYREKLVKAKEILQKMADGIDPLNGEPIEKNSFLHDPRMIRCLYFIQEVLGSAIEGNVRSGGMKPAEFRITAEEKSRVLLPQGKIGVNEFAKCVNVVIDQDKSKRLSGVELNRSLKKMGVLDEQVLADGKTRTALNARSGTYGIEAEKRNFNGSEYEMILFNDEGKRFLLDNLETILGLNDKTVDLHG